MNSAMHAKTTKGEKLEFSDIDSIVCINQCVIITKISGTVNFAWQTRCMKDRYLLELTDHCSTDL